MNHSILITGCSSGLGKAVALLFASQDYRVFAGVRSADDAQKLLSKNNKIIPVILDLSNKEQIVEVAKFVDQKCLPDGLSILINMAGYTPISPFEYTEDHVVREVFEVMLFGPIALTKALLPTLKRNFIKNGNRAKIINISSWAAIDAGPFTGIYSSVKAALLRLTESQYYEFQRIGIDAIAVLPGLMKSPLLTTKAEAEVKKSLINLPSEGLSTYEESLSHISEMGNLTKNSYFVPEPHIIAKQIFKIAKKKNPYSRYLIGKDTFLINILNKITPLCLLENAKMKLYRINKLSNFK
ncbi:SDR family NAD(P)-dependent oxidoreductase [Legionella cardiaca]|uniref:SDR family NAD(P)-dependent oxidoreductase n=1 Tax=Legionella cardiaca TaxID=1071983 RepID=A0ABY8AN65_9GAMM|nr:SDR family NAD(P)-dependent oxidoreductase [Legionella cardiaca]WED41968.1 SDR family NAD(P)-dependent oxidoreductase [Legionella cardiaca]